MLTNPSRHSRNMLGSDSFIAGNKSTLEEWFKGKGVTTGYLMGASE
jgi:hypothetical protein